VTEQYPMRLVEMDCPICNKIHMVEAGTRTAQAFVKGEQVHYQKVYYRCQLCPDEENEWVPAGVMDDNLQRAGNAYGATSLFPLE